MPQLVPFYFINQVTFAFVSLVVMIILFSLYILPRFVRLFTSRIYISQLAVQSSSNGAGLATGAAIKFGSTDGADNSADNVQREADKN